MTEFYVTRPDRIALPPCDCDRCRGHCVLRHDVGEKIAGAQPFHLLPCPDCHERHAPLHIVTGDVVLLAEPCPTCDPDDPGWTFTPHESGVGSWVDGAYIARFHECPDCDGRGVVAGYLTATVLPIVAWDDQRSISQLDWFVAVGSPTDPNWACEYRRGDDIGRSMLRFARPADAEPGGVSVTFEPVPIADMVNVSWSGMTSIYVFDDGGGTYLCDPAKDHAAIDDLPSIGDPVPADATCLNAR